MSETIERLGAPTIQHRVFEREEIDLDGNRYRNCKFIKCRLIFSGEAGVGFEDCVFIQCHWSFAGSAAVTLDFLIALNGGVANGSGSNLFDQLVSSIKRGTIGMPAPVAEPIAS